MSDTATTNSSSRSNSDDNNNVQQHVNGNGNSNGLSVNLNVNGGINIPNSNKPTSPFLSSSFSSTSTNNNNNNNNNASMIPFSSSITQGSSPGGSSLPLFSDIGSPSSSTPFLNIPVNTSISKSINKDTSATARRRKHQQSKSQSYSNFSSLLPMTPASVTSTPASSDVLTQDEQNEVIIEYCSVLKDRLKLLSTKLQMDQTEMLHKDTEIELLTSRLNKYNTEIREKEEENDRLLEQLKQLRQIQTDDKATKDTLERELVDIKDRWVTPQEYESWKEQIDTVTSELDRKVEELQQWSERYAAQDARIEQMAEQVRKERDLNVVLRQESEISMRQIRQEREAYAKDSEERNAKVGRAKAKIRGWKERNQRAEYELESLQKSLDKMKVQLSNSEIESLQHKRETAELRDALKASTKKLTDLSSSQLSMTAEIKQIEGDRLAIIGLMNRKDGETDERVSLYVSEINKSNDTISKLNERIGDLEQQLASERLSKRVSSISTTDTNYTISEHNLITLLHEKDDQLTRLNKQVQRLQIDSASLMTRYKKLEENMMENSTQLSTTKKSLSNSRRKLSKINQELLMLSDENYNESIGANQLNKRKSVDLSELSKMIQDFDEERERERESATPITSPLKQTTRRDRGKSTPPPVNNNQVVNNNDNNNNNNSNSNSSSVVESPRSSLNVSQITNEQLEDMLEKARSANIGYRLHIQFLSKEIKMLEKDMSQQKEFNESLVTRLNLDLEDSRRMNNRIKKVFLERFAKEEDSIFLDYYTLTDKFHPPNMSIQSDSSALFSPLYGSSPSSSSSSITFNSININLNSSTGSMRNSGGYSSSNNNNSINSSNNSITMGNGSNNSGSNINGKSSNSIFNNPNDGIRETQEIFNSIYSVKPSGTSSKLSGSSKSGRPRSGSGGGSGSGGIRSPTTSNASSPSHSPTIGRKQQSPLSPTSTATGTGNITSPTLAPLSSGSSNNISINTNTTTIPPKPSMSQVDLSRMCNRCGKEFGLLTRKYQCTTCTMMFCSSCCNTKTKTCNFCNVPNK